MLLISFLLKWIASTNSSPDANPSAANAYEVWCLAPRLPLGGSRQEHTGSSLRRRCQSLAIRNQCQQQQGSTATPPPARAAGSAHKK